MFRTTGTHRVFAAALAVAVALGLMLSLPAVAQKELRTTGFQGVKANTGYAVATKMNGHFVLTVSDDFVVPDTPAPHWQVVDTRGNVYLLQRFDIKENKVNRSIHVPPYVKDIAKVQVWCAWAETLLGEASFNPPVR